MPHHFAPPDQRPVVLTLGLAQTLAWASSFSDLPAVLATPIARDLGISRPAVFALLSMALIVAALVGPMAGRRVDQHGGRPVLLLSSGLFALGLLLLAAAPSWPLLALGWAVLGLAMGCGLYDTAFAALVHLYGRGARQSITGITLLAGFASTVGWPLTALMDSHWGWRGACLGWAALHLVLGWPLNARLPRRAALLHAPPGLPGTPPAHREAVVEDAPPTAAAAPGFMATLLALLFTLMGFVSTSIATHLPALLQAGGAPARLPPWAWPRWPGAGTGGGTAVRVWSAAALFAAAVGTPGHAGPPVGRGAAAGAGGRWRQCLLSSSTAWATAF